MWHSLSNYTSLLFLLELTMRVQNKQVFSYRYSVQYYCILLFFLAPERNVEYSIEPDTEETTVQDPHLVTEEMMAAELDFVTEEMMAAELDFVTEEMMAEELDRT